MIGRTARVCAAALAATCSFASWAAEAPRVYPARDWAARLDGGSPPRTFSAGGASVQVFDNRFAWGAGASRQEVALPLHVKTFVAKYRRDHVVEDFDGVDETIGPVVPEGERLWFGLRFYEGEGQEGVGGLGFFDPKTGQLGLLRHPGLVDCSSAELQVTRDAFVVRTESEHEYSAAECNGRVEIPRTPGFDAAMLGQARFEWDWFEGAVRRGRPKYSQRCRVVAGKPTETGCEPSLDLESARERQKWNTGEPRQAMERLVSIMVYRDMRRWSCSPGWTIIGAGINIVPARSVPTPTPLNAGDRVVEVARGADRAVRVRLASPTEAWEWTASGLVIEDLSCAAPFARFTGAGFTRATLDLKVTEVDQAYEHR